MSDPSFRSMSVAEFVDASGAKSPTPGGGSVAGVVGAGAAEGTGGVGADFGVFVPGEGEEGGEERVEQVLVAWHGMLCPSVRASGCGGGKR